MSVQLDHFIVSCRNQIASAKRLADLLGVPWAETGASFPVEHYCFRVSQSEFDTILGRIKAAGIAYRSAVRGAVDMRVDPELGNVYWNDPDGHQWEMLVTSYARPRSTNIAK